MSILRYRAFILVPILLFCVAVIITAAAIPVARSIYSKSSLDFNDGTSTVEIPSAGRYYIYLHLTEYNSDSSLPIDFFFKKVTGGATAKSSEPKSYSVYINSDETERLVAIVEFSEAGIYTQESSLQTGFFMNTYTLSRFSYITVGYIVIFGIGGGIALILISILLFVLTILERKKYKYPIYPDQTHFAAPQYTINMYASNKPIPFPKETEEGDNNSISKRD